VGSLGNVAPRRVNVVRQRRNARLGRAILATACQAGVRRHRMGSVAQTITIGYVATVRLASAAVCMGGVAILAIIARRAIAIVGIAIRRLEGRVRMVLVARISRVIRFALEHILESVVATSTWDCFA
jgi:hypothetical protein